jgi:hypothetical protein
LTGVGDPYGITTDLITKIPQQVLLNQVRRVAQHYRTQIQAAVENGDETIWIYATAGIWSKAELAHLKSHLRTQVGQALRPKAIDMSSEIKKAAELVDDSEWQYRDVPVSERLEKLSSLAKRIRPVLERLTVDVENKKALSEFFERLVAEGRANPDSFANEITKPW